MRRSRSTCRIGTAVVPYQRVEARALEHGVSVRGGCFCNPGAAERAFGFPGSESAACLQRARRGILYRAIRGVPGAGVAVGAVRASLGVPSNEADVARLVAVVAEYRNQTRNRESPDP